MPSADPGRSPHPAASRSAEPETLDSHPIQPRPATGGSGAAVCTDGLRKRFRDRDAVAGIDLDVPRGAVYGFLGPNGSGKTTTIRMLLGLIAPTAGSIEVLGEAVPKRITSVLPRVGSLVEGPAFHPYLNGRANLRRIDAADLFADPGTARVRIEAALERVGLAAVAHKRYRAFSLGMKQRLAIAAALLQPRDLLILDEPTNGLDPQGTREIRHLVADLSSDGTTVIVSSHLLSEIEQICTHIGVMAKGRLLAQGSLAEIRAGARARVRVETTDVAGATRVLTELGLTGIEDEDGIVTAMRDTGPEPDRIVVALVEAGVPVVGFDARNGSLEDEFIELTGEGFDVS